MSQTLSKTAPSLSSDTYCITKETKFFNNAQEADVRMFPEFILPYALPVLHTDGFC